MTFTKSQLSENTLDRMYSFNPETFTPENKLQSSIDGIYYNVLVVQDGIYEGWDRYIIEAYHALTNRRILDIHLNYCRAGYSIKKVENKLKKLDAELSSLDWTLTEYQIRSSQAHIDVVKNIQWNSKKLLK